jgi:hypothetical protein
MLTPLVLRRRLQSPGTHLSNYQVAIRKLTYNTILILVFVHMHSKIQRHVGNKLRVHARCLPVGESICIFLPEEHTWSLL